MKEMVCAHILPSGSQCSSYQLPATAAVEPGSSRRSVTISSVWLSTSAVRSSTTPCCTSSWLQAIPPPAHFVEYRRERGGHSGVLSLALTQVPLLCKCGGLTISAGAVGVSRSISTGVAGEFLGCGFSSLRRVCEENCHHRCRREGPLLGERRRRRRVRGGHWSLPALSQGGCVEDRNSSRACGGKKPALSSREFACCRIWGFDSVKRRFEKSEWMELFKPQLMDTVPFRFLPDYHASTTPPKALKDGKSPIFFFGFGQAKPVVEVVQAGDPVLHEPAEEVRPEEIGSARIEKIINDMVATMRNAPGVGLAAPQIGVQLQIIVLEDTTELMSYSSPEECEFQQRSPFDLLVIINPKLTSKSGSGSAVFFEGCLSVEGYRALVERDLEVEVTGLGRDGRPIRVEASGWKARILQHECDHLAGELYVDKMVPRTFRTKNNLRLPLTGQKQGVCKHSIKSLNV